MRPISIICTVKNGEAFLDETIESIRNQTWTDWEFTVVDDGSSDGTSRLLDQYAHLDPRIRAIHTDGIGRGPALNMAVLASTGKYIANIDADDPAHPQRIELQYLAMERHPDLSVLATRVQFIKGDEVPFWQPCAAGVPQPVTINRQLMLTNPITHSSVMMRKKDLVAIGLYDATRQCIFDYELWVRFAVNGYRIGMLPLCLAASRVHDGQWFEKRQRVRYACASARIQREVIDRLNGPFSLHFLALGKIGYGFLPKALRVKLVRLGLRDTLSRLLLRRFEERIGTDASAHGGVHHPRCAPQNL